MFLKVGDLAAEDHAIITGMRDEPHWFFHCACAILIDPPNILSFGVTSLYMGSSLSRIQVIGQVGMTSLQVNCSLAEVNALVFIAVF